MVAILLAACPFRGHVTPTVALTGALVEAGHDVRVLTGTRWADAVTAVGARHLPLPYEADLDETNVLDRFPERATLRGLAAPRFDMTRIFLDPVPAQLEAVDAALAEAPVDVIVAEPLLREIGEGSPAGFFLDWPLHGAGTIQLSVPSIEPADLPVPVHHVGTLQAERTASPPPPWWSRVKEARAAGTPVVHVTQGTVANRDPEMLLAPALRALADRPVLVVATTGGLPVADLDLPTPDNAVITSWALYELLLPRTDLLLTNGGYGGVHEALRHGVPIVLSGAQQDKAAVGARVRRSGVGQALTTLSPTETVLDRAVGEVLHDPSYQRSARAVAAEIAAAPGRRGAVDVVVTSGSQGR